MGFFFSEFLNLQFQGTARRPVLDGGPCLLRLMVFPGRDCCFLFVRAKETLRGNRREVNSVFLVQLRKRRPANFLVKTRVKKNLNESGQGAWSKQF